MTREAIFRVSVTIRKGNLIYQSPNNGFTLDIENEGGQTPGQLTVPITGVDIDLSELTSAGICVITNLSSTYWVEIGVHDGSLFHGVMELPPGGKPFIYYLSRNLGQEQSLPGTGTTAVINTLFLRAIGGTAKVVVEAFER